MMTARPETNAETDLILERTVDVRPEFVDGTRAVHNSTRAFFDGLANSLQRFHVDNINAAKTDETRHRRIEKAVALFQSGKKR